MSNNYVSLFLVVGIIAFIVYSNSKKTAKKETFDPQAGFLDLDLRPNTAIARSGRSGLAPRSSTERAEVGLVNDYFDDYARIKRRRAGPDQNNRDLPYDDHVAIPSRLNPLPGIVEFTMHEIDDDLPSAEDTIVRGLSDSLGQSVSAVKSGLDRIIVGEVPWDGLPQVV